MGELYDTPSVTQGQRDSSPLQGGAEGRCGVMSPPEEGGRGVGNDCIVSVRPPSPLILTSQPKGKNPIEPTGSRAFNGMLR